MKLNYIIFIEIIVYLSATDAQVNITLWVQALSISEKYSVICAAEDSALLQLSNNDIPIGQEWNSLPLNEEIIEENNRIFPVCEGSHIFIMSNKFIDLTKANNTFEAKLFPTFIFGVQQKTIVLPADSLNFVSLSLEVVSCGGTDESLLRPEWQSSSSFVTFGSSTKCIQPLQSFKKQSGNITVLFNNKDFVDFNILYAPLNTANLSLSRAFVSLNETLNFTCIPNDAGNPPAAKWQLKKINIPNPLAVLNSYEVFVKTIASYNDNGSYYCIVYNAFGSSPQPPDTQLTKLVVTPSSSSDYVTTTLIGLCTDCTLSNSSIITITTVLENVSTDVSKSTTTSSNSPSNQFNLLYLIAVVGGVLLIILIILIVAIVMCRRKTRLRRKQDEHGLHFDNPIFGEGVVRPTSPGNSLKKQQPVQRHSSNVTSANQSVPNARPSSQSVEDIYWSENNSYSSNTDLIDRLANQTRQSLQNRNSVPSLNSDTSNKVQAKAADRHSAISNKPSLSNKPSSVYSDNEPPEYSVSTKQRNNSKKPTNENKYEHSNTLNTNQRFSMADSNPDLNHVDMKRINEHEGNHNHTQLKDSGHTNNTFENDHNLMEDIKL